MRILQVSPGYFPDLGGVERHLQQLSEELTRRGHEVTVAALSSRRALSSPDILNGVEVIRFRGRGPSAYRWPAGLLHYLRRESHRFDVIHGHNYHALPLLCAAVTNRDRLVVSAYYHGHGHRAFSNLLHRIYGPIANPILRSATHFVCLSNGEADLVASKLRVPRERITVLPSGTMTSQPSDHIPGDARRTVLTVGRLESYKRVDRLINCVPFLAPEITVDIVGAGPAQERLMERARSLGVEGRVRFLGRVDETELRAAYARAAVYVSLSEAESFGISVLDALAAGCRVVASSIPAFRDFVDSFPNSVTVVEPADPAQVIAAKIAQAWDGPATSAAALDRYSWSELGRAYEDLYGATLKQGRPAVALAGRS